jgi:hypothetical protein
MPMTSYKPTPNISFALIDLYCKRIDINRRIDAKNFSPNTCMNIVKLSKCLVGFMVLLVSVCGFAGEPTLQSVQTFPATEKTKKVIFLYEEKNLNLKETSAPSNRVSNNRTYLGDTGFPGFGDLLVTQSSALFANFGLSVIHSGYAPEGRLKDYQKELQDLLGSEFTDSVVVVVTPLAANTSGGIYGGAGVNVQLSVAVRTANTGESIWSGLVNTSTHVGKGFIASRLFASQLYDQAYALAVLDLLAKSWQKTGIF